MYTMQNTHVHISNDNIMPPLLFPQPRKEYGTWMGTNVLNFPPRISPFPLRNIVASSLQDFSARITTKNYSDI
jgi:hypothetical protein